MRAFTAETGINCSNTSGTAVRKMRAFTAETGINCSNTSGTTVRKMRAFTARKGVLESHVTFSHIYLELGMGFQSNFLKARMRKVNIRDNLAVKLIFMSAIRA